MPKCPHCHESYTYKQLLPFAWNARVGVRCQHCDNTSYNSANFRKKATLIVFIVPVLLVLQTIFNISFMYMYVIFAVILLTLIFTLPLFSKLTKEEEPLW